MDAEKSHTHSIWSDEHGGVTSDWMVIGAGLTFLGIALIMGIKMAGVDLSGAITTSMDEIGNTLPQNDPMILSEGITLGQAVSPACIAQPDGATVCDEGYTQMCTAFNMSDGTTWTRCTKTTSTDTTVTWVDAAGQEMNEPQWS